MEDLLLFLDLLHEEITLGMKRRLQKIPNAILAPTNTAFVLTTDNSADANTGDGDLDVVVYYTIETENT